MVFLAAHIFALYLPASAHWSIKHAPDAGPQVLGFHCISSQGRLRPAVGIAWMRHATGGQAVARHDLQSAMLQGRSNATTFECESVMVSQVEPQLNRVIKTTLTHRKLIRAARTHG